MPYNDFSNQQILHYIKMKTRVLDAYIESPFEPLAPGLKKNMKEEMLELKTLFTQLEQNLTSLPVPYNQPE